MKIFKKYYKNYWLDDFQRLNKLNKRIGKASTDEKQLTSLNKSINFISRNLKKAQKSLF